MTEADEKYFRMKSDIATMRDRLVSRGVMHLPSWVSVDTVDESIVLDSTCASALGGMHSSAAVLDLGPYILIAVK